MINHVSRGDRVEWNSQGGTGSGTVEEMIVSRTEAGGRAVDASKDEPQHLVRSDMRLGHADEPFHVADVLSVLRDGYAAHYRRPVRSRSEAL